MQKWSEWNHKDSESKGKWERKTCDIQVRVKPKNEPMTPKCKSITPKCEPKMWTGAPKNTNQKRKLKECSKPNLKSERNGGVIETMTQWHAQQWKRRQSDNAQWRRMKHNNESWGYDKSLILTRGRYYVGCPNWRSIWPYFTQFFPKFTRAPRERYYIAWDFPINIIWLHIMSVGISQSIFMATYYVGWELPTDLVSLPPFQNFQILNFYFSFFLYVGYLWIRCKMWYTTSDLYEPT